MRTVKCENCWPVQTKLWLLNYSQPEWFIYKRFIKSGWTQLLWSGLLKPPFTTCGLVSRNIWFPFIIFIASVSSVITSLCHSTDKLILFMIGQMLNAPPCLISVNVKSDIDVQTDLQKHHPTLVNQGDILKDPDGDLRCSFHLLHISWTETV